MYSPHIRYVQGCNCDQCRTYAYYERQENEHREGLMRQSEHLFSLDADIVLSINADAMLKTGSPIGKLYYGAKRRSSEVPNE